MITNKTIRLIKKLFFLSLLGFVERYSRPLSYIEKVVQLIPGTYKSKRPNIFTGIDKLHLKCDCITGLIVNGVREPILYSFAISSPPGHKIYKEPRIKPKINKPKLSQLKFCLENDDHKPVDFDGETIGLSCQLIKI